MRTKRVLLAGLMVSLVLGAWSVASASQRGEIPPGSRLRERISDLYLIRLTRALELTEEQTAKLYPLLTRAEKDKAEIQRRLGSSLQALRAELAKSRPGEETAFLLTNEVRESRRAIQQIEADVEASLDRILTPVQRARYLLFTVDFLRSVGENVNRARVGRGLTKRTP